MGPPLAMNSGFPTPAPGFQKRVKRPVDGVRPRRALRALRTPTPPWTPSRPRQMIHAAPDCRHRHGHCGTGCGAWASGNMRHCRPSESMVSPLISAILCTLMSRRASTDGASSRPKIHIDDRGQTGTSQRLTPAAGREAIDAFLFVAAIVLGEASARRRTNCAC
jgi:hypothetical protein